MLSNRQVKAYGRSLGFHKVGITPVPQTTAEAISDGLRTWLAQGFHADMEWMKHPRRQDIRQCLPGARSLICVALNYYVPGNHSCEPQHGKIARYGWGRDYHRVMQRKLRRFTHWLITREPGIQARYYVDTGPVQDKVWAERAGLGWIGKHSNLITREYGSWVFLGEILTTLALIADQPHTQHCGTCTRCMEACPTQAIAKPFVVDANRCLAYHTIENRAEQLPESIVPHLGRWVAGCDICQDVCPWNQRFAQPTDVADFQPYPDNIAPKLTELANLSPQDWDQRFRASALRRIKLQMWHRNAQANLSNS